MALLMPTAAVDRVTDITSNLLHTLSVETVLIDVDNTLALRGSQEPLPGTVEWSWNIRRAGFQLAIMSNNFAKRVGPFAAKYELPFLSLCMKPLPYAYHRAVRGFGTSCQKAVVVGDQVFTDILGANLVRMKSILLTPIEEESSLSFRVRRCLEKPVREKMKSQPIDKRIHHKEE